ncbi:MAG: transcriptional repressor [Spirochaetia bacterium]|nr:transcriptional repressor [Spirochaetia bacterium]
MKRRRSKQRKLLYKLIETSGVHPTTQWLLAQIKKKFPAINEANLYRNIRILI